MTDTQPITTAPPASGTGAGIMGWFAWLIDKHEVTEANGSSLRTGVRNVLLVDDDWGDLDMRTLDLEKQIQRFRNAKRGELAEPSVEAYARRFRQSVESYRRWLDGEKDWNPVTRRSPGQATRRPSPRREATTAPFALREASRSGEGVNDEVTENPEMLTHRVPLRSGKIAALELPIDLTPTDARRISRIVESLAMDEDGGDTHTTKAIES